MTISVKVTDAESGVKEVQLLYSLDGGASWVTVPMIFIGTQGPWEGTIPGQPAGTQIQYKVIAYDNAGNSAATSVITLQIPPNQNPQPTPLTPLTLTLTILVIIASIFAIGATILKLKKRKSKIY